MSVEHIIALNKRITPEHYKNKLRKAGIMFDPMKRFHRIFKVWVDNPNDLPMHEYLDVVSRADDETGPQSMPTATVTGTYKKPRMQALTEKVSNVFKGNQHNEQQITFDLRNKATSGNWGLARIVRRQSDFDGNWPYKSTFSCSKSGKGVDAYVVDSGVDNHPDLKGRINWLYGSKGDGNGHGTHVATTVGGRRYGVAKHVQIHVVQVLGANGSGSFHKIVEGLDTILEHHQDKDDDRPSVVNMSLGGKGSKTGPIATAVDELIENGVVVVVAAGNDNFDLGRPTDYVPAEVEPAITVGATSYDDSRARFSNYGEIVDIWAPGHEIVAGYPNQQVACLSGTSMASPHVAGVMAHMLEGSSKGSDHIYVKKLRDALIEHSTDGVIEWDHSKQSKSPNRLLYICDQ